MSFPTAQWCRSRRGRALCTRPAGHAGLHNRQGTSQMWADADADAPACPGGGAAASPARRLPDGFPHGRALCPECSGFVEIVGADAGTPVLAPHDAFRRAADAADARARAEWFNAFGWD